VTSDSRRAASRGGELFAASSATTMPWAPELPGEEVWEQETRAYNEARRQSELPQAKRAQRLEPAADAPGLETRGSSIIPFPHRAKPDFFPALTARTSLFSASKTSRAETGYVECELTCQKGYSATFVGPRLNMHDKLVWDTAVQIAKERLPNLSDGFVISLREFAQRMGWKTRGGPALRWIWASLRRLYSVRVSFRLPNGKPGGGALLATALQTDEGFYIRLNADFAQPAFLHDHQFRISIEP
jgi:hypothetical protein